MSVRLGEDDRLCLLVVIGVTEDGAKELLAVEDGYRESTESWAVVMRDLKDRGMSAPKLVCGDGALGAWAALRDVFPAASEQRCWVHKTANCLDALPKRLQPPAKGLLHEMAEAPSRADAQAARERFREQFDAKYPKAVAKLDKDWAALTAFYDFPAEHWRHLRTTNPIESAFATVKLRTRVTKGAGSRPRRWRWPTSCSKAPKTTGASSTRPNSSPTSSTASSSKTADATYGRFKKRSREYRIIGGNTTTSGNIDPFNWVKWMRLRNGKPPRMDMFGHNPFGTRGPDLKKDQILVGTADFSDLDIFVPWVDRWLGRAGTQPQAPDLHL